MDKKMPRLTSEEMAKLYEERAKEYREKAVVTRVSKGGWEYSKKAKEAEAMAEYYRSKQFYAEHGHPEYAGKYAKPTIPEGYTVEEIKEVVPRTPTGVKRPVYLEFTFKPPEEPKGIAETLMSIHVPSLPEILGYSVPTPPELLGYGRMEAEHYTMTEPLAGFVGAFEVPAYTVARWAGVETPRIPPSLVSGYSLEHPAYAAGAFAGTALQSYLLGKAIAKSPLGPPLAKAEMKVMGKIRVPIKGTKLDVFLLKRSAYWRQVQEYSLGKTVFGKPPLTKKPFYRVYHGKPTTPMSVTLKKAIADTKGRVLLPQLLMAPKTLLTPTKTVLPFSFFSEAVGVSTVLGLKVSQVPTTTTKTRQTLKLQPLTRQELESSSFPITRQKERASLFQFSRITSLTSSLLEQPEKTMEIQSQTQKQSQKTKQMMRQMQIQTSSLKLKKLRIEFKAPKRKKTKKKKVKGEWWLRTWPVKRSVFLPKSYKLNGAPREKSLELKLEL